jgi:hypothetical protein
MITVAMKDRDIKYDLVFDVYPLQENAGVANVNLLRHSLKETRAGRVHNGAVLEPITSLLIG